MNYHSTIYYLCGPQNKQASCILVEIKIDKNLFLELQEVTIVGIKIITAGFISPSFRCTLYKYGRRRTSIQQEVLFLKKLCELLGNTDNFHTNYLSVLQLPLYMCILIHSPSFHTNCQVKSNEISTVKSAYDVFFWLVCCEISEKPPPPVTSGKQTADEAYDKQCRVQTTDPTLLKAAAQSQKETASDHVCHCKVSAF